MMRKLSVMIVAIVLGPLASTATKAAVGVSIQTAIADVNPFQTAGCYRLGETGYHWYSFCLGPRFLYPHHRICRHSYCYYR
jgi:hypothetical protein